MSWSYDASLPSDLDKVRFHIGDVTQGDGPRPDRGNFSNEELLAVLGIAGSWPCAVARLFEALSSAWASRPVAGPGELGTLHGSVSGNYDRLALKWAERCGAESDDGTGSITSTGSVEMQPWGEPSTDHEYRRQWYAPWKVR